MKKKAIASLGMMNHPAVDTIKEIYKAKKMGFDFLDLTLEPPCAGVESFNLSAVEKALDKTGLGVVGHTGWHLDGHAAYPEVRQGVLESLVWAANHFSALGAKTVTYHIQGALARYIGLKHAIKGQIEVLSRFQDILDTMGMTCVLEHTHGRPEQFEILDAIFDKVDGLGFHLDIGHANLSADGTNKTGEFVRRYKKRLLHVHISDNKGVHDEHLPLGVGSVNWPKEIGVLLKADYARTVTLEVFSTDDDYLALSLKKARKWFAGEA